MWKMEMEGKVFSRHKTNLKNGVAFLAPLLTRRKAFANIIPLDLNL